MSGYPTAALGIEVEEGAAPRRRRQRRRASQPQNRLQALGMVELLDSTDDEMLPAAGPSNRRQRTPRNAAERDRLAGDFSDRSHLSINQPIGPCARLPKALLSHKRQKRLVEQNIPISIAT